MNSSENTNLKGEGLLVDSENVTEWILSVNPNMFDHIGAFAKRGYIDWRQFYNFSVGDIVYMYCSKQIHRINAVAEVIAINLSKDEAEDFSEFWNDGKNQNKNITRYFRLRPKQILDDDRLDLHILMEHGLSAAPQIAYKLNQELSNYIHSVLKSTL